MELGEYVRFKNGEIGKIIDIKENPTRVVYSEYGEIGLEADIEKHSFNILDLIRGGDFIETDNGIGGMYVRINENTILFYDNDTTWEIGKKEIKSIVTREQFDRVKYEVEDKKR